MWVLRLWLLLAGAPVLAQVPAGGQPAPGAAEAGMAAPAPAPQSLAWTEAAAREVLGAVRASAGEGLSPADYGLARLEAALAGAEADELSAAAEASWMALARDYAAGHTPAAARRGWKGPAPRADPEWLRAKLADGLLEGGPGAAVAALLPTHPHYAALRKALAAANSPEERALIRANLDRWRWLPRMLGERYLIANLPAYEVDLWDDGRVVARHRIIIGKPALATPQFSAAATGVTMNPPWLLPQSIVAESVGALIRRSPRAARAKGYRWTRGADGRLYVTQVPGPGNSLGQMKIEMPNEHAIFFHDTPAKALFDREVLALSHGCMRTKGVFGLGLRLLEDQPEWGAAAIDAAVAARQTVTVPLTAPVPVHVAYFTVAPGPGGTLRRFADVYGRDAAVIAALGPDQAIPNRPA
jgi:murein L,D-transpeptidase YcbB/YkuD